MKIELTAEQAEQFKKEGKITIEMPKEEVKSKINTITGYYVGSHCDIGRVNNLTYTQSCYNTYATKEQAEASIAQARLTQEMKLVNGDWEPSFINDYISKHSIEFYDDKPRVITNCDARKFLCFKDSQTATKFLSDHYDLIMAYKPLT